MNSGDSYRPLYRGGVCFITDRKACDLTSEEMALLALRSGIRWIQYREKGKSRLAVYRTALRLRELSRDFGACLVINDHTDIAAAVDADGVHLGQDDLPVAEARKVLGKGKIIGISTHSLKEALRAEADGADYIGFGPVMHTMTKDAGAPKGVAMLKRVSGRVGIPVVAIGGVNSGNLDTVISSGAHAVAVASAILKGDVCKNVDGLLERLSSKNA